MKRQGKKEERRFVWTHETRVMRMSRKGCFFCLLDLEVTGRYGHVEQAFTLVVAPTLFGDLTLALRRRLGDCGINVADDTLL
jgi:hypothetical protein